MTETVDPLSQPDQNHDPGRLRPPRTVDIPGLEHAIDNANHAPQAGPAAEIAATADNGEAVTAAREAVDAASAKGWPDKKEAEVVAWREGEEAHITGKWHDHIVDGQYTGRHRKNDPPELGQGVSKTDLVSVGRHTRVNLPGHPLETPGQRSRLDQVGGQNAPAPDHRVGQGVDGAADQRRVARTTYEEKYGLVRTSQQPGGAHPPQPEHSLPARGPSHSEAAGIDPVSGLPVRRSRAARASIDHEATGLQSPAAQSAADEAAPPRPDTLSVTQSHAASDLPTRRPGATEMAGRGAGALEQDRRRPSTIAAMNAGEFAANQAGRPDAPAQDAAPARRQPGRLESIADRLIQAADPMHPKNTGVEPVDPAETLPGSFREEPPRRSLVRRLRDRWNGRGKNSR